MVLFRLENVKYFLYVYYPSTLPQNTKERILENRLAHRWWVSLLFDLHDLLVLGYVVFATVYLVIERLAITGYVVGLRLCFLLRFFRCHV